MELSYRTITIGVLMFLEQFFIHFTPTLCASEIRFTVIFPHFCFVEPNIMPAGNSKS